MRWQCETQCRFVFTCDSLPNLRGEKEKSLQFQFVKEMDEVISITLQSQDGKAAIESLREITSVSLSN